MLIFGLAAASYWKQTRMAERLMLDDCNHSYDDHPWIREAYADCRIKRTHANGNGGAKRELIIQPVESKQTNTSGACDK